MPSDIHVDIVKTPEELLARMGAAFATKMGDWFMGTLFKQGNRIQFASAGTIEDVIRITEVHSSQAKDDVTDVRTRANRPEQKAHGKGLREYLKETACIRDPFILPGLTANFGYEAPRAGDEFEPNERPKKARLVVWVPNDSPDVTVYMAVIVIPKGMKLTTTDGGHRWREINRILGGNIAIAKPDEKEALKENSLPFVVVFEPSIDQLHQDFADCGKAKPISKSLLNTYDRRDDINRTTVDFVEGIEFVKAYTDATTNTVNLSGGSAKAWSMSAWRNFVNFVCGAGNTPPHGQIHGRPVRPADKMETAASFIEACVRHIPQLADLEARRVAPVGTTAGAAPVDLRKHRGGSVLLRGVGLSILARAFAWAKSEGHDYDLVANALGTIDWNLLTVEKGSLPQNQPPVYAQAVLTAATPLWRSLIVINDLRYRVASSTEHADHVWGLIKDQIEPQIVLPEAAE